RRVLFRSTLGPGDGTAGTGTLALGLVAAGLRGAGIGAGRDRGARPAHGALRPAVGLRRRARLAAAARVVAPAPPVRADDPRLAGAGCCQSPGQAPGHGDDGAVRRGHVPDGAQGVDGGHRDHDHGDRRDLAVAPSGTTSAGRRARYTAAMKKIVAIALIACAVLLAG